MNESFVVQILRIGVESQGLWGDEEKTGVLVKKEDVVRIRHFKEKMSLEEAHHHRRSWIRA